ncbi:MAG: polysaccharide deacetylase family protein [Bacteroidales bacterium]|nr:polysaccharide deacetylase family protein [Bacteroidales bacterium]
MKRILFNIVSAFTFIIPIKFLIKLTGIKIIYPFYHIVNNNPPAHIKHLYSVRTEKQFRKDLDFLTRYFQNTKEVLSESKDKQNYFHLSFDDGLSECYTVIAPILKEYNIKATFFINSGFVDNKDLFFKYKASIIADEMYKQSFPKSEIKKVLKVKYENRNELNEIAQKIKINFNNYLLENKPYLTSKQIKKLSEGGHQIGAHSIDHPLYSDLNETEQIKQTSESIQYTENKLGTKTKLFAFPFTDDQVETTFFDTIFQNKIIDFSFGTAGIKKDSVSKNIQRIPIEKKSMSAKRYIKTEYLLYFLKKLAGKHIIKRK